MPVVRDVQGAVREDAMSDLGKISGVLVVVALLHFAGFLNGYRSGERIGVEREQQKAVEAGVGRWTIDPVSGEKTFEYGR